MPLCVRCVTGQAGVGLPASISAAITIKTRVCCARCSALRGLCQRGEFALRKGFVLTEPLAWPGEKRKMSSLDIVSSRILVGIYRNRPLCGKLCKLFRTQQALRDPHVLAGAV